jgi:hypothetical protein
MKIREVQIRRREPKSHLPVPVINNAIKKLGSHFVGQAPLRGLSKEQEEKYLPGILGIDADDREWSKTVTDYWAEFTISVPGEGVVLNISTLANGEPLNVRDWISYQWALKHKLVAANLSELRKDPRKMFYVYDPEEADKATNKQVISRMKAYQELIKLVGSKSEDAKAKMGRVLRILTGVNPERLTDEQVQNRLEQALTDDATAFYNVVTDKDLDIRAEIDEMLEYDVLSRIGNHLLFQDDIIGESMEEAIQYFKGKSNSQTVTILKAKLQESKKSKEAIA